MERKKFLQEEKDKMAVDYAAGKTLRQLCQEHGVSVPTMAKYIRSGGGEMRKKGKRSTKPVETTTESSQDVSSRTVISFGE